jgi:SAM-dependent methyltransferase
MTSESVSNFYNQPENIKNWSRDTGLYPVESLLIKQFFPAPPARILDIGCGAGRTTRDLIGLGYTVTAIDLADELLKIAQSRAPAAQFFNMNAANLDFPDASFDAVFFSYNGMDHVYPFKDRLKVIKEVKRVLIPGGIFYFSGHNINGHFGRKGWLHGFKDKLSLVRENIGNFKLFEGYWLYKESLGSQFLYSKQPKDQFRVLQKMGFQTHCICGQKRYSQPGFVVLRNTTATGFPNSDVPQVSWIQLVWQYPHIHHIVSI